MRQKTAALTSNTHPLYTSVEMVDPVRVEQHGMMNSPVYINVSIAVVGLCRPGEVHCGDAIK